MRQDTKHKILAAGAQIMHLKGYNHTGIQEILDKAGVPKGSFYNFFKSKEDFGLQVIDYYSEFFSQVSDQFFKDDGKPPLERIRQLFTWFMDYFRSVDYAYGCPIGNFAQEMGDLSPAFREKLNAAFNAMARRFSGVLRQAQDMGQLKRTLDVDEAAGFIVSSWEGALMSMKVKKSTESLETHMKYIFESVLMC